MKKIITLAAISCTTIALTACGDDVTNVTENNVGVQSFESFQKLPDCTKDNQGEMAIATKEGLVYYCDDEKWKKLNGEPGEKGEKGDKGETGAKGDAGVAGAKGEQGKKGDAGADGKDGSNGKDGSDGTNGVDGKDGEPGTSCTMAKLEDNAGYKVLCGGDSVGVVLNGKNGNNGINGTNGKNCTAEKVSDGVKITCDGGFEEIIKNGKDGVPGVNGLTMCGTKSYNPNESVCVNEKLYPRCGETYYNPKTQVCVEEKVEYNYGELVDDRDDSTYKTVVIGKQTWMAENLKHVTENSYCNEEDTDCTKYGRYYTWAAAMGKSEEECGYGYECVGIDYPHQGVCPGGWHLPTKEEWEALMEFISKDQEKSIETVGYYLKTNSGWNDYGNGNDYYGFSALPAGSYYYSVFRDVGNYAYFWSATKFDIYAAYGVSMDYHYDGLSSYYTGNKHHAYPVRCVKNAE